MDLPLSKVISNKIQINTQRNSKCRLDKGDIVIVDVTFQFYLRNIWFDRGDP